MKLWGLIVAALLIASGCQPDATSLDRGCRTDQDCLEHLGPGSSCQTETRVCVAVTSSLGALDADTPTQDASP